MSSKTYVSVTRVSIDEVGENTAIYGPDNMVLHGPYDSHAEACDAMWELARNVEKDLLSTSEDVLMFPLNDSIRFAAGEYDECGWGPFVTEHVVYLKVIKLSNR